MSNENEKSGVEKAVVNTVESVAPDMKTKIQKFVVQLIMETLRTAYLAAYPIVLFAVTQATISGHFEVNWQILGFTVLLAVIKGVDRALHETGIALTGLSRF